MPQMSFRDMNRSISDSDDVTSSTVSTGGTREPTYTFFKIPAVSGSIFGFKSLGKF